jgi:hypothetical protein
MKKRSYKDTVHTSSYTNDVDHVALETPLLVSRYRATMKFMRPVKPIVSQSAFRFSTDTTNTEMVSINY